MKYNKFKLNKNESNVKLLSTKFKCIIITINLIVILAIVYIVQQSYAYMYTTLQGKKTYSLRVKGYSLNLDESSTSENITITNSNPMSDDDGKQTTAYTFSVNNDDSANIGYILYLDDVEIDDEINRMSDVNVKYQLIKNGNEKVGLVTELGVNPFRILHSDVISGKATDTFSLRFWIKEGAEVSSSQQFSVKLRVIATDPKAIEEGRIAFGDTVVTTNSGITQMNSAQLQTYVNKALESSIVDRTQNIKQEVVDEIHPVGSIYITTTNVNPSETLGGTWERYGQGKSLVGVDETTEEYKTVEKSGGSSKVTLSEANLPNHSHSFTPSGSVTSSFTGKAVTSGNNNSNPTATFRGSAVNTSGGAHTHATTATTLTNPITVSNASIRWRSRSAAKGPSGTTSADIGTFRPYDSSIQHEDVKISIPSLSIASSGSHSHSVTAAGSVSLSGTHTHSVTASGTVSSSFTGTAGTTGKTGSGEELSVQNPYITVYMWKRIS